MGGSHSLALKHDGSVLAWGSNSHGQLGAGIDDPYQVLPVNVTGFSSVEAIAAGAAHSAALKNDGIVWAWGKNVSGQLGNGTETDSNTPLQVSSLTEVKAVVLGENHSLALKKDGTVWSWGDNTSGQLGNGSNVNSKLPVKVTNLRNIKAIAGGSSHSLAVCSDGTVWGWGYNTDGQLGNGATTPSNVPLKLPGFRLGFLHILYLSPSRYLVAEDLGVGSSYYVDRTYTITEVPAEVKYASWIKTGNADKTNTSDNFINFTLPRDAVVYIAYDSRATSLPTWMSGFINTGLTLKTTDVSLKLYAKFYPAGKVTLGGNLAAGAAGAATNYVVAVKEVTQPALMQYLSITKYPVAEDLGIGSQYYSDRTYTITELPAELNTATWIKTGNAEKTSTSDTFLSFNLNRDAMLYVAYDSRAASLPTWMSGFINTGLVIKTTDVQLKLYAKFQAAGRVTLGGNLAAGAAGAATNYVVVAKEAAALPLIKYVSPAKYPVADNLGVGSQYYSDRTYTITEFPTELGTASWIKTGNAEKTNTSDSFLTFTLNRDAVVYVAYDSRATSLPNWMSGLTNTGLVIKTTDVQLKIYAKFYAAGPVTLGGNLAAGAAGAATNYLVIVKEAVQSVFIKYVQPSKYPVVENLAVGSQYYTDRTYTITDLPVDLNMASWIKTGNADKTNTSENFLGFTLARDAMVYVAYDSRATSLPNWMSGFTSTGQVIKTTDVQLKIYARFCNAGNITLGGNLAAGAAGAGTNYVVIIKE
jgi:hypothetical protein